MAKLSARGRSIVDEATKRSDSDKATWTYRLMSDGAVLRQCKIDGMRGCGWKVAHFGTQCDGVDAFRRVMGAAGFQVRA